MTVAPSDHPAIKKVVKRMEEQWPKIGQPYYFITSHFTVEVNEWNGTRGDQAKEQAGNMFKSREQAEAFAKKMVKFLAEHNRATEAGGK